MNQEEECDHDEVKLPEQVTADMADATMDSENEMNVKEVNLQIQDKDQDEQQSQPLIKTPPPEQRDATMEEMHLREQQDVGCCERCCKCCMPCLNKLDAVDKKLSNYIFKSSPGKVMDVIIAIGCLAFSYFGFPLWIVLYVVIMQSYLYALCVLVSIVVTQIMKRCFKRPRPRMGDLGVRWFYLQFEDVSAEHSFPSGDTAQAAVFSVTLGYSIDEYYWLGMACVVPFVALGRVYYGRHYIGDTLGGAITGVLIGYLMNQFLVHHMW